jgi:hypothetical protein
MIASVVVVWAYVFAQPRLIKAARRVASRG